MSQWCLTYITFKIYSFNYIAIDQQSEWKDKSKMQRNSITVYDSLDCHPNTRFFCKLFYSCLKHAHGCYFLGERDHFWLANVLYLVGYPRVLTNPRDWVRDTARRGFDYYSSLDLDTPLDASRGAALHQQRVWRSVAFESIRWRINRVTNSVLKLVKHVGYL